MKISLTIQWYNRVFHFTIENLIYKKTLSLSVRQQQLIKMKNSGNKIIPVAILLPRHRQRRTPSVPHALPSARDEG